MEELLLSDWDKNQPQENNFHNETSSSNQQNMENKLANSPSSGTDRNLKIYELWRTGTSTDQSFRIGCWYFFRKRRLYQIASTNQNFICCCYFSCIFFLTCRGGFNGVVILPETQQTLKANINSPKINVNDIVLVYDETVPRHFWRIAIVTGVLPTRGKAREQMLRREAAVIRELKRKYEC